MKRQEFIDRCNTIFNNWCTNNFQEQVEKLIDSEAINIKYTEPNSYKDCYPVIAAILESVVNNCINGSSYEKTRREQRKAMKKYLKSI